MRSAHPGVMSKPFTYRDLVVWKLGMDLVERCYKATASFPKSELHGLTAQLRRACMSIPSNVAEGHGRRSTKAYDSVGRLLCGLHRALKRKLAVRRRSRSVSSPNL